MKTNLLLHRMIFAALGFLLLLLTGCGGSDSSPTAKFATDLVAGKTFAYTSASVAGTTSPADATGALAFNADGTWRRALASSVFSGTWSIDDNGRLVCVTTVGDDHTITYTLRENASGVLKVSAVEVNPAEPAKPASYTATFSTAFATEMIAGQKLSYASGSGAATSNGVIEFGHDGSWKTTTGTASYGGTWNVVNGKLVCVITTGGDHTITYTRLDANANPLNTSASEVAPSAENNPVISIVTFSVMDSAPISTPEVQSQNALKEAFTYLQQVGNTNASEETRMDNANKALGKTIDSYELYPNKYSLLVKASIEGILNKLTDAEETLSKVDVEYPEHSEGKFIKAYLSAKENKDAAEVLKNLKLSMNNDFSGMGEKLWRGFIDKLPAFANFRTTPEYTELLNMKTILYRTAKTNSCKQNKTYYDTRWFGMEIGISHDDKENYLDDPIAVVSFLALFTPEPLPILLGGYLIVESIAINILEKDCGIQLNNTWLNIGFFIPTAQN